MPAAPSPGASQSMLVPPGSSELMLLAQRAVYQPDTRSLLVADLHLGKAASFRTLGVPVPAGTTERTLDRLTAVLALTGAKRLFVLGDLFHARPALSAARLAVLAEWRAQHSRVEIVLVRGNHDDRAGDPPPSCGIETVSPGLALGGLSLHHEPPMQGGNPSPGESWALAGGGYWVAGHLHPVARIGGRADALRLPCFWVRNGGLVLPAFGEFTGGWAVKPGPGEALYVTDGERVHRLPNRRGRAAALR